MGHTSKSVLGDHRMITFTSSLEYLSAHDAARSRYRPPCPLCSAIILCSQSPRPAGHLGHPLPPPGSAAGRAVKPLAGIEERLSGQESL